MKAAQITAYGGESVINFVDDTPQPKPGEGQVLVKVLAAAVNPFDIKVREGMVRSMKELEFPAVLGGDLAGEVVALGDGVTAFSLGQQVFGQANALSGHGAFAEFAPAAATSLALLPGGVEPSVAAASSLVGCSAYQALVDTMHLKAGQRILIHGGAGGIGSIATQIAKSIGAHVAVTARAADADFVSGLGVDEVIDYESQDFAAVIKDYDAVYDTVGGDTTARSYAVLKPGGVLVTMLGPINQDEAVKYGVQAEAQFTQVTTHRLEAIGIMLQDGTIKVNIDKTFPLEETAAALEYLKTGHPRGKVVIEVA